MVRAGKLRFKCWKQQINKRSDPVLEWISLLVTPTNEWVTETSWLLAILPPSFLPLLSSPFFPPPSFLPLLSSPFILSFYLSIFFFLFFFIHSFFNFFSVNSLSLFSFPSFPPHLTSPTLYLFVKFLLNTPLNSKYPSCTGLIESMENE